MRRAASKKRTRVAEKVGGAHAWSPKTRRISFGNLNFRTRTQTKRTRRNVKTRTRASTPSSERKRRKREVTRRTIKKNKLWNSRNRKKKRRIR
jgi:hypothetical protein